MSDSTRPFVHGIDYQWGTLEAVERVAPLLSYERKRWAIGIPKPRESCIARGQVWNHDFASYHCKVDALRLLHGFKRPRLRPGRSRNQLVARLPTALGPPRRAGHHSRMQQRINRSGVCLGVAFLLTLTLAVTAAVALPQ